MYNGTINLSVKYKMNFNDEWRVLLQRMKKCEAVKLTPLYAVVIPIKARKNNELQFLTEINKLMSSEMLFPFNVN